MPRTATKLKLASKGGFIARKVIPFDVRDEYAKLYGQRTEERLLDLLVPPPSSVDEPESDGEPRQRHERTREKMRSMLASGALDERRVELSQETLDEARRYGKLVPIVVWPDGRVEQGFGDSFGCFI